MGDEKVMSFTNVRWWRAAARGVQLSGKEFALLGFTVATFVYGGLSIPGFVSASTGRALLVESAFLGIAATGQMLTMLIGGVDLSIPYLIALGDVGIPYCEYHHIGLVVSVILLLVLGLLIGAFSGLLTSRLHTHSLIITLGIGYLVYGILLVITQGVPPGVAPQALVEASSFDGRTLGLHIPVVVVVWLLVWLIALIALQDSRFGRQIYASGMNSLAGELALAKRSRISVGVFAVSALLATMTGIFLAGYTGTGDISVGLNYLFLSVGAAVVGGTSLLGGKGSVTGTAIGAFFLTELVVVLIGHGLSTSVEEAVFGGIILVAVAIYGREPSLREQV